MALEESETGDRILKECNPSLIKSRLSSSSLSRCLNKSSGLFTIRKSLSDSFLFILMAPFIVWTLQNLLLRCSVIYQSNLARNGVRSSAMNIFANLPVFKPLMMRLFLMNFLHTFFVRNKLAYNPLLSKEMTSLDVFI